MDREQYVNCFQLDDNCASNQNINPIAAVEFNSFVLNRK